MLDERWRFHRFYFLRQNGLSCIEIGKIFKYHPNTIRQYAKRGEREDEHIGTLYYFLSERARKWLLSRDVDTTRRGAHLDAAWLVNHPDVSLRSHGGHTPISKGLGSITRNEILNAIDFFLRVTSQ